MRLTDGLSSDGYAAAYADGAASVDITSDNDSDLRMGLR